MSQVKPAIKELVLLACPLVFAQIAHISMQIVDTIMLGRLGPLALATGSLGGVITYNVAVFFVGILSSTGSLLAQAQGANDTTLSRQILSHSLLLSFFLSLCCIAIIIYSPFLLQYFHLEPALIVSVKFFLNALAWGIPPWLIFFVLRDFVAVYRKTRIILIISIFSVPLNALLNYILMYGKLGLPEYGIAGVGMATSLVRWSMLVSLLAYIYTQSEIHMQFKFDFKIQWQLIAKMCKLGVPTGMMMGFEIAMFSISAVMMGYFGIIALAAHQVALQCANAVFTIPLGISQAVSIQIGRAIGAKQSYLVRHTNHAAITLGFFIAIVIGMLFYTFPVFISKFFIDSHSTEASSVTILAIMYLSMAAILQFLDTFQIIMIGVLRGMNDTFMPMLLGIVAYWLFGLSAACLFGFVFDWQGIGLWFGLCIGIGVSVFLLFTRFYYLSRRIESIA